MASVANFGVVVSVRGSVVDVRFTKKLPAIHTILRAGENQNTNNEIIIEVLSQLTCAKAP